MKSKTRTKACLFGGALFAAGIAATSNADFIVGESSHNHGLDAGPIVSSYAGAGSYTQLTLTGAPFGPTTVTSAHPTGTQAQVILSATELTGTVSKEIESFGYIAFVTAFTVTEDMNVTVTWDASTAVPTIDRRFRVWQSLGPTLFEYDEFAGPHSGTTTISLQAGEQYRVDALYRSIWANGDGTFSLSFEQPCPGDITGDGSVDFEDLNTVLGGWDVDYDFDDLNAVLGNWNVACD